MKTLGIDVGSSSVKVSLMDVATGEAAGSVTLPANEMAIDSPRAGWAEQEPQLWWEYVSEGIRTLMRDVAPAEVGAIGITYQMHGLVCLDKAGNPLRKSIIWCDSRAVDIGAAAQEAIGYEACQRQLLNSPGNFTASKLAWVKRNEPEIFDRTACFMLPGDYILYKLSGEMSTTSSGLSEQILWDFQDDKLADSVIDYYGIRRGTIPRDYPSIGVQARVSSAAAAALGLAEGTPIAYRAGDQPNNAFSLNVMNPGEIAATGGTSGVVYGVTDIPRADPLSRVNTFLHVNHTAGAPRYGVLLCINGTGILNAWIRRTAAPQLSYDEVNALAATVGAGSEGVLVLPFGNGAERMLENRYTGTVISGIDLNRHTAAHLLRAAQEGIAFAFRYGVDVMRETGLRPQVLRAGRANLFLSPLFRQTLATLCDVRIELYNTDGALGAARGAALGAGLYKNREEAFASLRKIDEIAPDPATRTELERTYHRWKLELHRRLQEDSATGNAGDTPDDFGFPPMPDPLSSFV